MAEQLYFANDEKEKNKKEKQKHSIFGRSLFGKHKRETDEHGNLTSEKAIDTEQVVVKSGLTENLMEQAPLSLMDSPPPVNTQKKTADTTADTPAPPPSPAQSLISALVDTPAPTLSTEPPPVAPAPPPPPIPESLEFSASSERKEPAQTIEPPLTVETYTEAELTINTDADANTEVETEINLDVQSELSEAPQATPIEQPVDQTVSDQPIDQTPPAEEMEGDDRNSISLLDNTPELTEAVSEYEKNIQEAEFETQQADGGDTKTAPLEDRPPSKLGERMIELGLISKDQLHVALKDQGENKKMLGEVLVHHGFVTEAALTEVLSDSSGYERFDLEKAVIDTSLLNTVPKDIATNYRVFPVSLKDDTLYLAMADVYDIFAIDQIRRFFPAKVEITPLISSDKEIAACIQKYFGYELSIDGLLTEIEGGNAAGSEDLDESAVAEGDFSHPVVRLVNSLLLDAIKVGASDMHLEPEGNYLRIRYRIDGEMRQIRSLHKSHWSSIANRIKIMGNMDVANRIEAQDGRIQMMLGNSSIDFRVSSLPTIHGENFVLRVLDKSTAQVAIQQLGFSEENYQMLETLIAKPEGIIIVTGPTGSGKTTTLYAILNHLNSIDVNIMTLEDPVEYELPLIRQCQVREGSTVDFEHGIKALLRQDPDIILIGEVRNQITAIQTLRAAMTGHQVFTTLHTNSAVGALPRLMDLGIHPGLMAGNIVGILGQRLSRKLCPHCKDMQPMTEEEAQILKIPHDPSILIGHKVGCPECEEIGLKGRVAISEVMPMAKELEDMLSKGETTESIRRAAIRYGFKPMANDALDKILEGSITIESALKVIDLDERLSD